MSDFGGDAAKHVDEEIAPEKPKALKLWKSAGKTPAHKQRLYQLFTDIEKEFDRLHEENHELKKKLKEYETAAVGTAPANKTENKRSSWTWGKFKQPDHIVSSPSLSVNSPNPVASPVKEKKSQMQRVKEFASNILQPNLRKCQIVRPYLYHTDAIWDVQISPTYSTFTSETCILATASADHTIALWQANLLNPLMILAGHKGSVNSLAFHPTKPILCSASGDQTCQIWKVKDDTVLNNNNHSPDSTFNTHRTDPFDNDLDNPAPQFEDDEEEVHSDQGDIDADVLDDDLPPNLPQQPAPSQPTPQPAQQPAAAPKKKGISLFTTKAKVQQPLVDLNTLPKNSSHYTLQSSAIFIHQGVVAACDWISNSDAFVTVGWDGELRVFDMANQAPIDKASLGNICFTDVKCAHQSQNAVTCSRDHVLRIWDLKARAAKGPIHTIVKAHSETITSAVYTPNDRYIISGAEDGTLKYWDVKNLKSPLRTINTGSGVNRIAISDYHSRICVSLNKRNAKVYDLSGQCLSLLGDAHSMMVTGACWSNDGNYIYTSSIDKKAVQWMFDTTAPQ